MINGINNDIHRNNRRQWSLQYNGKELVFDENERSALVSELKMVNEVMVGHSDDYGIEPEKPPSDKPIGLLS